MEVIFVVLLDVAAGVLLDVPAVSSGSGSYGSGQGRWVGSGNGCWVCPREGEGKERDHSKKRCELHVGCLELDCDGKRKLFSDAWMMLCVRRFEYVFEISKNQRQRLHTYIFLAII